MSGIHSDIGALFGRIRRRVVMQVEKAPREAAERFQQAANTISAQSGIPSAPMFFLRPEGATKVRVLGIRPGDARQRRKHSASIHQWQRWWEAIRKAQVAAVKG